MKTPESPLTNDTPVKATCGVRDGFTLLELLVVIAIIAILAGLILSTAGYVQKKAARSRAEAEIQALSTALESYKADMGDYPRSADYTNSSKASNSLYSVLAPSSGKVYFEFDKGMKNAEASSDPSFTIIDPFGEAYKYVYPGAANKSGTNFFDLWSFAGASGTKKTDVATNWVFWVINW